MSDIKDFVEFIVKHLVDIPLEILVTKHEGDKSIIIEVHVAKSDFGKVIGKHGNNANALRTLVGAVSAKHGKRATVEIIE